jgi:hypothetical protein
MLLQNSTAQLLVVGPAEEDILQCPSTASSGRKLIVTRRGGSYDSFLPVSEFGS